MFKIIFELAVYNGPVEGICKRETKIYYYCITQHTDILRDELRAYYLYELDGIDGKSLTWQVITEDELTKEFH